MTKRRFNEIKDVITKSNERKLMTKLENKNITLKNAEKVLKNVISGNINKEKARNMYSNIAEDENKLSKLELTESRKKMLPIFKQLQEILMGPKADDKADNEADDKSDVKTDDEDNEDNEMDHKTGEQSDTTDMPDLESAESAAQRRNQRGQGLKTLTPQQMLSRLPISLAQSEAGNNSEKLKNELRQLLYSLYR